MNGFYFFIYNFHAFDKNGKKVWERQIDCYGRLRSGDNKFIPFLYTGQYVDKKTGLAYNRFRYYDVESGRYMSQDPIGLAGGMALYNYILDSNGWVDEFGLVSGIASSWNQFQSKTSGWFSSRQEASTGWKIYQQSSQSTQKLAIRKLPDTEAAELAGMRRLNTPGWTPAVNDAWMQGGIDAKKDFYLASAPTKANRVNPPGSRFPYTVFDRELKQLDSAGYKRKGQLMKYN
jgi:RHS repeat-associated protein